MFVYILLNCEYMDYASRNKWYLRNLKACKEHDALLITHEYLINHFEEIQEELNERLLTTFDIEKMTRDDIKGVDQSYIPDSYFDKLDKEFVTRTAALSYLYENRNEYLEDYIIAAIKAALAKRGENRVEGIFFCLEPYQSIKAISEYFNVPLIAYSFSAIRSVHGYRDTLYTASIDGKWFNSNSCEESYIEYTQEEKEFNLFSNKELISLLGKERTLPLMAIMHHEPYYDLGICGEGFLINTPVFSQYRATDDDIFYECNRLFKKIDVRQHPIQMTNERFDRTEKRNDAAPFILNCKRITSICSQIMLKALLWDRTAVMKNNTLDYSFACEHDYLSEKKIELDFLNFYILAYMVPADMMFDLDYWRWRLVKPSWSMIMKKHLEHYVGLGWLTHDILQSSMSVERQAAILRLRGIDDNSIAIATSVIDKTIDFAFASSKIALFNQKKDIWRVNFREDRFLVSEFDASLFENESKFKFYPLDDMGGFIKINEINIDGGVFDHEICDGQFHFFDKNSGNIEISLNDLVVKDKVEIIWEYLSILDYCRKGA